MNVRWLAILLALSGAPPAAIAQTGTEGGGPISRLLAHRAELELSAEQVRQLQEIERRTTERDRELVARIEALRGGVPVGQPLRTQPLTPEQRAQIQANRAELQPLMRELRTIHWQAIADARGLLTSEQNQRATGYLTPGVGAGRGPGAGWGPGGGRGRGWAGPAGRGWGGGGRAGRGCWGYGAGA
jgi:hypothetical protein